MEGWERIRQEKGEPDFSGTFARVTWNRGKALKHGGP